MSGHVVVEDTTASDLHPHEYVQVSKSGCDHDEKVTGHDDLGMVVAEGQPARFRIRRTYWATVSQVLLHGARGNPDPELQLQFVGDAFLRKGHFDLYIKPADQTRNEDLLYADDLDNFHAEGSLQADLCVIDRTLRILFGEVGQVVKGIRQSITQRGLSSPKRKTLNAVANYLYRNRGRMRYDEYLANR